MIRFDCPTCSNSIKAPAKAAGKRGKCNKCGEVLRVPAAAEPVREMIIQEDEFEAPLPTRRRIKRPQQRHKEGPVTVEVHQETKPSNSLGIASLVMGILAFMVCWVPLVNIVSIPLAGLGLLLSAIGLFMAITRKGTGIGYPIASGAINGIALAVAVTMWVAFTAAANEVVTELDTAMEEAAENRRRSSRALSTPNADSGNTTSTGNEDELPSQKQPILKSPWDNASSSYDGELVSVKVIEARIGKVPLKNLGSDSTSTDILLALSLEVSNKQESKKMEFSGWKGASFSGRNAATLEDEHENNYKRVGFGFSAKVVGQADNESIYPLKSVGDVLVFELPIDTAKELRLKLPASAYGSEGVIHLVVPTSEIVRDEAE